MEIFEVGFVYIFKMNIYIYLFIYLFINLFIYIFIFYIYHIPKFKYIYIIYIKSFRMMGWDEIGISAMYQLVSTIYSI